MMRRYPAYRDSGVDWLGEVPEGWGAPGLKRISALKYGDALSSDVRDADGGVEVFGSNGPVGFHSSANTLAPVILVGRKGSYGALNWSDNQCFAIDTVYFIDRTATDAHLRWLFYAMHIARFDGSSQDTGVPGLSRSVAYQTRLPLPPLSEQTAIAAFLDRETGKIDALVAEQRRLIALLREKRQATISHAVTRGLNPAALLKPSGVDWLGDVPEGWEVSRIGKQADILSGYAFPSEAFSTDDCDTPLLRGINVGAGEIRWDETVFWARMPGDGLDRWELNAGDLVIGMDRPWIGGGTRVAFIEERHLPCLLLQRVAALRTGEKLDRQYLFHHLTSDRFRETLLPDTTGVSVPHISPKQIAGFQIPLPPITEQRKIAAFLAEQTARLDALITTAESAISLLLERRAALISAAVTGKIDVREAAFA